MRFAQKAGTPAAPDDGGIPCSIITGASAAVQSHRHRAVGTGELQSFLRTGNAEHKRRSVAARIGWCDVSRQTPAVLGLEPLFDWEYRTPLRAPWYSGLAQGQGISLLVRVASRDERDCISGRSPAFSLLEVNEMAVSFYRRARRIWFEEYIVSPPTHILNGFIWAPWGVYDVSGREDRLRASVQRAAETCARISIAMTWDSGRFTSNRARGCPWSPALSITSCTSCSCG